MIRNKDGSDFCPPAECAAALQVWIEALQASSAVFEADAKRPGVDLACLQPVADQPNRARLKLFAPEPGVLVAFYYKDSQVPFSTDRFAYGASIHRRNVVEASECAAGIAFLLSGLHPEQRPVGLKRAFPFDIPR